MGSHIIVQDPSSISAKYSNSNGLQGTYDKYLEDQIDLQLSPLPEEDIESDAVLLRISDLDSYLARIPEMESDLINLYYRDKMKQEQIARLFNITQAAVSYRLQKGRKRIQFLRTIPRLDKTEFEIDLGPKFSDQDREILWLMYIYTCQSKIAKELKLTQGRVRHRFFRALDQLKGFIVTESREKQNRLMNLKRFNKTQAEIEKAEMELKHSIEKSAYAKYWMVFNAISDKKFNILNEVSLPQFMNRRDARLLTFK